VASDEREIYRGFGDTLARAFEFAVTPAVFGVGGHFLDRWLGSTPLFTITLTLAVVIYLSWRLWRGYDAEMRAHESHAPWGKPQAKESRSW
jgi:F0F1-type ATP synthase assembly protein I